MPSIRVHIDPQGKKTMTVEGAVGKQCESITEPYLRRAGVDPNRVERVLLPEYTQEQERQQESG